MLDYVGLLKGVRSPDRVRSSQIIGAVVDEFEPLGSPDAALIAGTGSIEKTRVLVFAQEKPRGRDAETTARLNYGMMTAAGYWFVVEQLERAAEKGTAVVTLIDTPGADPSRQGVEHLLAWSISACIAEFLHYSGPTLSVVIGEGGSGGALALQVADRRLMVSDAIYSVIAPESCSAILYRDSSHIQEALELLRPSATDVLGAQIIDEVIDWSGDVAVSDHDRAVGQLRKDLVTALSAAIAIPNGSRVRRRRDLILRCGALRSQPEEGGRIGPSEHTIAGADGEKASSEPPIRKFATVGNADDSISVLQHAYFSSLTPRDREAKPELICPRASKGCGNVFSREEYRALGWACPHCGRGERLSSAQWICWLCDEASFEELYPDLDLAQLHHGGYDNKTYRAQREEARARHGVGEAVRVGIGQIKGRACALAVSDFRFFGGSLGAACGEKIRLLCEVAQAERLPLIALTCSGGARMQDGTLGLVQMAKTNAAIMRLLRQGIPYISILTDPCTGGALGSYATLGTVLLAEPRALIAFAGPRVMRLAGLSVDENLLDSEHAARHGGIDEIVPRSRLRARICRYLDISHRGENDHHEPSRTRLPSLTGRYASHWFADFTSRLSTLLDEAHDLVGLRPGAHVAWASIPSQLADLALETIPAILEQATRAEDPDVRARAARALARFPRHDRARPEQALRDEHPRVQANAAYELLLSDREHPDALAVLRGLLAAEDASSRRAGLFVVGRIPVEALRSEVNNLCGVPEVGVRVPAIITLFAYGDVERGSKLLQSLVASVGPYGARLARRLLPVIPPEQAESVRKCLGQIPGDKSGS